MLEIWTASDGTQASGLYWAEAVEPEEEGDPVQIVLHQVYVESSGWRMRAEGHFEGDVPIITGPTQMQGTDVLLRATLHGIGSNHVVHITDFSTGDGGSWQRLATLHYYRAATSN